MTNTEPQSPFTRRGFIAAAIVVGIIVLAAIIVLVTTLTRGATDTLTPTTSPSISSSPTENDADKSVCGLPGFETKNTLTKSPTTKWELVGTIAAPTDLYGAGPGVVQDGFRSCFAHTAEGALYAAINLGAMGTDSRLVPELAQRFLVPGPGRDAAIARQKSGGDVSTGQNLRAQLAGFKISSYDDREATIDLVFQVSSTGQLVSIPTVLQWYRGDWKGVTDENGNTPLKPAQVQNLGGYIPWAGA